MIPWAVVPAGEPEEAWCFEAGCPGPEAGPASVEVLLGTWRGVPVWVQGQPGPGGSLTVQRLVTTDPELYLWPALAPGSVLHLR